MRVISQDGTMDFPYNLFCFTIRTYDYECCIVAYPISHPNNSGTILATYSSEEKAKDSMSYLHAKYNEFIFDKYANYKIDATFRFPTDDEV